MRAWNAMVETPCLCETSARALSTAFLLQSRRSEGQRVFKGMVLGCFRYNGNDGVKQSNDRSTCTVINRNTRFLNKEWNKIQIDTLQHLFINYAMTATRQILLPLSLFFSLSTLSFASFNF